MSGDPLEKYSFPWIEEVIPLIPKDLPEENRQALLKMLKGFFLVADSFMTMPKEGKQALKKFRACIDKARKIREEFSLPNTDGKLGAWYPIKMLFSDDCMGAPEETGGYLTMMSQIVDSVIGRNEPTRYPRLRIIDLTLFAWTSCTGKDVPRNAKTPDPYAQKKNKMGEIINAKKDAVAYALCRVMIRAVEGADPGDFQNLYERVVRRKYSKKIS